MSERTSIIFCSCFNYDYSKLPILRNLKRGLYSFSFDKSQKITEHLREPKTIE